MPRLADARCGSALLPAPGTLQIVWPLGDQHRWHLLAQLAAHDGPAGLAASLPGQTVYCSHPSTGTLPAWSVRFALETH